MLKLVKVYFVEESIHISTINPIAIEPKINEQEKMAFWKDTSDTGTTVYYKMIRPELKMLKEDLSPKKFEIVDEEGKTYHLTELTKKLYDLYIKPKGTIYPDFKNDDEVQNFYKKTSFIPL